MRQTAVVRVFERYLSGALVFRWIRIEYGASVHVAFAKAHITKGARFGFERHRHQTALAPLRWMNQPILTLASRARAGALF